LHRTRTIVYTATDACGNTKTCTQVLTWTVDSTPPALIGCPAPTLNLGANPAVPTCANYVVTATDDCGVTPTVTCASVTVTNGCGEPALTYTATGGCGRRYLRAGHHLDGGSSADPDINSVWDERGCVADHLQHIHPRSNA
jgi:hypothetical protein